MSYQRAWAISTIRLFFAFVPFYPREGKYGVLDRKIYYFVPQIKFKLHSGWSSIVRGEARRVNGEGCASFRKSVQNFFFWARTVCAEKNRARPGRAPAAEISNPSAT
jgi:hypothetical protein